MKNKDLKKSKESTIGKIIYGFLLFMPLLAVASAILVNTFNINAKNETNIEYKYKSNEVYTENDLKVGNIYKFTINQAPSSNLVLSYTTAIYNLPYFNTTSDSIVANEGYLRIDIRPNDFIISNNNAVWLFSTSTIQYPVTFDMVLYEYRPQINYGIECFSETDFNVINNIEEFNSQDIFYKAIEKVEQSNLFNWAENSSIYTVIHNTCIQLSITTTFIPLLLAYWLIISVIYILYDIILMVLIILHNKIHQLQDSLS